MASLTLTIDEDVLRRVRLRALEQNTTVDALVCAWLENYVGTERQQGAAEDLITGR